MTPRNMVRSISGKRLSFVATLEMVFGAMNGTFNGSTSSAEDRILRRAANDAEQR